MHKNIYSVLKKKRNRAEYLRMLSVLIQILPSSRLPHMPSPQPDIDKGYSSTFGRNTLSSENTYTELPVDYLTHSHQAENTSFTSSVVVPATNDPLTLPPHRSSASTVVILVIQLVVCCGIVDLI